MQLEPYYQDESVTLYHANCEEVYRSIFESVDIDLLLTDPPYGIDINDSPRLSRHRGFKGERWDKSPVSTDLLLSMIVRAKSAVIWGGNFYSIGPSRGYFVWDKDNDGRSFGECEYAWTNLATVPRIFRMKPQHMDGGKVHPTQKPERLIEWCIEQAAKAGDLPQVVFDPFAGSGTTGRVCKNLGLKSVLVEQSERYCEIIKQRMSQEVLELEIANF